MKYLIKDKGYNNFMMANSVASYCDDPGKGIHDKLPRWLSENGDCETEVIKSTDSQFRMILVQRMIQLESEINNYEGRLREAKKSFNNIITTLEELTNEQSKESVNVHS